MELNKGLGKVKLSQAKTLYKEAFDDSNAYIEVYFNEYMKNNDYYFIEKDNKVIFSCCNNKKRVYINNKKYEAAFIVAVSTKKEFQGQGLMKSVFQQWLDKLHQEYDYIFIQAYNWDIYKSYEFYPCTLKNTYELKNDQYLKPIEYTSDINYSKLTKIQNKFIKLNKFKNFSYKTTKENQQYYKMLKIEEEQRIAITHDAYIIFDKNNIVYDFAFLDLKNFIRLLSNFKDNHLKIRSYLNLDKRYFKLISENKIDTKVYKHNKLDIYFNESF